MTHGTSLLGQVFKMRPRAPIESLDHAYGTGHPSRVLSRWSPFGTLVFAQLAGRHRLRDVVTTMASPSTARAPLGLTPPKRSTLAAAKARRPAPLYQTLLATRYACCRAFAPGHGLWFNSPLVSLDSTTISLGLRLFPWARFRSANGAVKVHMLLDHGGDIPAFVVLTAGQPSAITVTSKRQLPRDSLVTMARGAVD